jgi:hypothetical protein
MRFGVNWQFWEDHSHFVAALVRGLHISGAGQHIGGFSARAFHYHSSRRIQIGPPGLPIL